MVGYKIFLLKMALNPYKPRSKNELWTSMRPSKFVGTCLYLPLLDLPMFSTLVCTNEGYVCVRPHAYYQGLQGDSYNTYHEHISIFIKNTILGLQVLLEYKHENI
jgi:hypothetical protein